MRWATQAERHGILEGLRLAANARASARKEDGRDSGVHGEETRPPSPPEDSLPSAAGHQHVAPGFLVPLYVLTLHDTYLLLPDDRADFTQAHSDMPLAIVEESDLHSPDFWNGMLAVHPTSMVDLARWWKRHIPDVSPTAMMLACGLGNNHRSLADWREMSELDDSAAWLHRTHELPLAVLRLWNRLSEAEKQAWLKIFSLHPIKRNLMREILMDYYDLEPAARASTLRECQAFSEDRRSKPTPFPAQQLRDLVHRQRYARSEPQRNDLFALKRRLQLPRWIDVEIPSDLEGTALRIQADLSSERDVDELLGILTNEKHRETLRKMRELLQS